MMNLSKFLPSTAHQLTTESYLKDVAIQGGFGCTVSLTDKARNWMASSKSELKLTPNAELQGQEKATVAISVLGTVPKYDFNNSTF